MKSLTPRLLSPDLTSHLGAAHEVAIAASLLSRDVALRHEPPGGPDFEAQTATAPVGIECTSVHIGASVLTPDIYVVEPEEPGAKDLSYKLASTIRAKGMKAYAAPDVLLSIDATNIFALSGGEQPGTEAAEAALAATPFGAVMIWVTNINLDVRAARDPGELRAPRCLRDRSHVEELSRRALA